MQLKRKLGFWDVFCLAAGAMISSGLFVLPGQAFSAAGPGVVLAYALASIAMLPAMFSQAELATAMPKSGGSYFFIERAMGALPGTLAGLANWFSIALKSAFALIGIGAFAQFIGLGEGIWTVKLVAAGGCVLFTALNLRSVKMTGKAQSIMVIVLLVLLVGFLVVGLPEVHHAQFAGFMDKGFGSILATAALVFVSYGGLTKVASVAGEIKHPGRNIPAGMFSAAIIVSLLYVAAVFVAVGVTPAAELDGNLKPLTTAAQHTALGTIAPIALGTAALLAFFSTANGGILAASRSPLAMSHDGLLPPALRKISRRYQTPYVSILLTSGFMLAVILALSIPALVKVASTMMLLLFALVNLAVLVMRSSRIQNYRPMFRAPGHPYLQIVGIVLYGGLIALMGREALLTTAVFLLVGVGWYFLYARTRSSRESALIYMMNRLVSREIRRGSLEEELREIAMERDEVTHDRFDQIIQNCAVVDIAEPVSADEMFRRAAEALADRLEMNAADLHELFRQREAQSSTVIQPGLAIPHVIIPGEHHFDVLLIRCREGAVFLGQDKPVRVAFVLVGTTDERNYHLRALMAVAHVAAEPGFMDRWLAAGEAEHLRDIVLLSERQREA